MQKETVIKVQGEICETIDPRPSNKLGTINIVENVNFLSKNNLLKNIASTNRSEIIDPVKSLTDKA